MSFECSLMALWMLPEFYLSALTALDKFWPNERTYTHCDSLSSCRSQKKKKTQRDDAWLVNKCRSLVMNIWHYCDLIVNKVLVNWTKNDRTRFANSTEKWFLISIIKISLATRFNCSCQYLVDLNIQTFIYSIWQKQFCSAGNTY